jgi:hypothetical protein
MATQLFVYEILPPDTRTERTRNTEQLDSLTTFRMRNSQPWYPHRKNQESGAARQPLNFSYTKFLAMVSALKEPGTRG